MTVSLCAAPGGSAPGSWCDEVMRGDVVIQQFLPKGHICSLSFGLYISLHLSRCLSLLSLCPSLSVYLLSMHSAVCASVPVRARATYIT